MNPERWKSVKQIAGEAMERSREEQAAFVAAACAGDPELAAEVASLLDHDLDDELVETRDPLLGERVGPYRLREEIGHGGMGTVYLADRIDGAYSQRVAVQVIRRGMDTDHLLRRFRTERQILAALSHPNIARLLDGGALPDGRPYLVMEHVEGRRIDDYCREEGLGVADRLRLFLRVCEAVSFAHQHLVVHRDIKPGNVLVDATNTPKLLDFGIAKLLHSEAGADFPATESVLRPMTPEYASPEQISGAPVTTATDVYALGVMLYELLTGRRPHTTRESTPHTVLEAIRTTDPAAPSAVAPESLRRRLQGDVDVILLTALRREPERRYPSVEAFAADVRRHLEGQPVLARKDSWTYRAGRYLSRNAVPVVAAAVVAIALLTGAFIAISQARVARAQRAVAEKRHQDTLRLTNAMLFELFEGIDQGPTRARQMLVERALGYLDRLAKENPDDPALMHELAAAYGKLAAIQAGTRTGAGAGGLLPQARASQKRALALRERLSQIAPAHFENRRELGILHVDIGAAVNIEGRSQAAVASFRKGLALLEQSAAERPRDFASRSYLVSAHLNLAQALGSSDAVANLGRPSEALPQLAAAIRDGEALVSEYPEDLKMRQLLVAVYNETAICLDKLGKQPEALAAQKKAIEIAEWLVQRYPDSLHYRRELAVGYGNRAARLLKANPADALEYTLKALPLYESIAQSLPGDGDATRDLAIGCRNVGKAFTGNGHPQAAIPHIRRAIALLEPLLRKSPNSAFLARQLAFTHLVYSETLTAAGDPAQALAEVRKGIRIGEKLVAGDASNMGALRTLALSYAEAGKASEALARQDRSRWRDARGWYLRSRDAWIALDKGGEIAAGNAQQVTQVREAIARCDAAISRL